MPSSRAPHPSSPPNHSQLTAIKLHAVIHKAEEGGYWAEVPALPGCVTQAETIPELEANLREA